VERRVRPELLDELSSGDPQGPRSRRDLRVLNAWMRNARIMAKCLRALWGADPPEQIVELGGGDGSVLLKVACRLGWRGVEAVLVDRQDVVSPETRHGFKALGWELRSVQADALEWLGSWNANGQVTLVANLFIHEFAPAQLPHLIHAIAERATAFVAVEPRRSHSALLGSRLVWLLGCNAITRHDAPVSVRAGFTGGDLSMLWPGNGDWVIDERPAGFFSHLFCAHRKPLLTQKTK
jgi:hypothetical protein